MYKKYFTSIFLKLEHIEFEPENAIDKMPTKIFKVFIYFASYTIKITYIVLIFFIE